MVKASKAANLTRLFVGGQSVCSFLQQSVMESMAI